MSHQARPNSRKRAKHEEFPETALVITKQTVSAPPPISAAKVISEASTSNSNNIRQSLSKSSSPERNETDGHANLSADEDSPTTATDPSPSSTRNMVIHYGKEALCLLAILLTTMASYQG